jgi:putative oxidoreductase
MNITAINVFSLLGRVGLSAIFIVAGVGKIFSFQTTAAYMATKGIPFVEMAAVLAIIIEVGGGLALLFGWKTRWAAIVLALFVIVVTFIFHAYWTFPPAEVQTQMQNFLKNFAIIGGLFYAFAFGAGGYSIDGWRIRKF